MRIHRVVLPRPRKITKLTLEFQKGGPCRHIFDDQLACDGDIHYYPCIMAGCSERRYFSKHTAHKNRNEI